MTERTFFRTKIVVEVLSEYDPHFSSLGDVAYAIEDGDCSGNWDESTEEINGFECAVALLEQESDPSFFFLTEDGEDLGKNEEAE
jgi:hypothetical protein